MDLAEFRIEPIWPNRWALSVVSVATVLASVSVDNPPCAFGRGGFPPIGHSSKKRPAENESPRPSRWILSNRNDAWTGA